MECVYLRCFGVESIVQSVGTKEIRSRLDDRPGLAFDVAGQVHQSVESRQGIDGGKGRVFDQPCRRFDRAREKCFAADGKSDVANQVRPDLADFGRVALSAPPIFPASILPCLDLDRVEPVEFLLGDPGGPEVDFTIGEGSIG